MNEEESKWVPQITVQTRSYSRPAAYSAPETSGPSKRVQDLDPKELYRNVK